MGRLRVGASLVWLLLPILSRADEPPTREAWMQLMQDALPKRNCTEGHAGRNCYRASESACLAVETDVARECLAAARDQIPERVAVRDGARFGAEAGICTADRYELLFGDLRDLVKCPLDDQTAKTTMKRAEWTALLDAGLAARLCAESGSADAQACRAQLHAPLAKCLATVGGKAPAKLSGKQRTDWLKKIVACMGDARRG